MAIFEQLVINGIIAGAIYALIATGFSLVYNIKKIFHIAHGGVYALSAFIAYAFMVLLNFNFIISFILTLVISAFIGILINRLVYSPLKKEKNNQMSLLLASFGALLFMESLILLLFGAEVKTFSGSVSRGYDILGIIITKTQIILLVIALLSFIVLQLFLKKTRLGKALRATSDNREIASTLGINTEKITMITFAIGSALAAVAGILVGMEQNIHHTMGLMAVLKGFTAAIIGGLGNIQASVLGGFFLGIVENLGIWILPSGYKDAIAFLILIIFLLYKPRGFFGIKTREETSG